MGRERPGSPAAKPGSHRVDPSYLTGVVTLAWLSSGSGSGAVLVAEAPFVTDDFFVVTLTVTASETDAPAATVPTLHLSVPLAPTAGFVQVAPAGATRLANTIVDGSASTM